MFWNKKVLTTCWFWWDEHWNKREVFGSACLWIKALLDDVLNEGNLWCKWNTSFMMFIKVYCLVCLSIICFKFIFYFLFIFSESCDEKWRGFWKEKDWSYMESCGIINKFNNWYGRFTYGVIVVVGDDGFPQQRKPTWKYRVKKLDNALTLDVLRG